MSSFSMFCGELNRCALVVPSITEDTGAKIKIYIQKVYCLVIRDNVITKYVFSKFSP